MKRIIGIAVVVAILLVGGGLTAQLIASNNQTPLPALRQTDNPEGSVKDIVPWQAEQFFLAVGFILVNLIGIGVTIAAIMWFLDRGVRTSRAEAGITDAKKGGRRGR